MIDPAQSFSNALNQGLGIMKSYRDEARQNEKDAFDRDILLRAEAREAERAKREAVKWGWDVEDRDYIVNELRPLELRGKKAEVSVKETNAAWLPKEKKQNYEKGEVDIANTRSVMRSRAASDAREAARFGWDVADRKVILQQRRDRDAVLQIMTNLRTGGADYSKTDGTRFTPRYLASMAGISPRALDAVERTAKGDFSWMNDKATANAARSLTSSIGTNVADKFGFKRGTVAVDTFLGVDKGGRIRFKAVGRDAKTNKLRTMELTAPSTEVFIDNSVLAARSFAMINRDPNAKATLLGAMRSHDEKFFDEVIQSMDPTIRPQLKALESQLEKAKPGTEQYTAIMRKMDEVTKKAAGEGLFERFQKVSAETSIPIEYRAVQRQKEKLPGYANAPTEKVVGDLNRFVSLALASDKNYTAAYKSLYGKDAKIPMDANRRRVLRDETALWRGLSR